MRKVSRSALVPYTTDQMYAVVDDVESYPSFLPWCESVDVHERDADFVEATLHIRRSGIRKSFRTRNRRSPPQAMSIHLVDGPFRRLEGAWALRPVGDGGCRVSLEIEFEFDSAVVDLLFGRVFEEICNSLVDAFTRRADQLHGGVRDA